jgi:hypothetical protein
MLAKLLATAAITALLSAGGTLYMRTGLIASLLGPSQMHAARPLRTATVVGTPYTTTPPSANAGLTAGATATASKVSVLPAIVTSDLNGSLTFQPISASAWSGASLGDDPSPTLPVAVSLSGTAVDGLSAGQHVLLRIADGGVARVQPTP